MYVAEFLPSKHSYKQHPDQEIEYNWHPGIPTSVAITALPSLPTPKISFAQVRAFY